MPKYRMTYPYARVYPSSLGRVEPGQEVTAKENPDPNHFEEVPVPSRTEKSSKTDKSEPAAEVATSKES